MREVQPIEALLERHVAACIGPDGKSRHKCRNDKETSDMAGIHPPGMTHDGPDQNAANLPTPGPRVASIRAQVSYRRVLTEFARISKKCRKRKGLSVEDLAERSGVSVKRIKRFESGSDGPSWPEVLMLASVYRVRVSLIAKRLRRIFEQFAGDDARSFGAFLHTQRIMAKAKTGEALFHSETDVLMDKITEGLDDEIVDMTIADWPIFLPPSFGESILSECTVILSLVNMLDAFAAHAGSPVPIEWSGAVDSRCRVMASNADLLDRIHFQLLGIATRLEWHVARQFPDENGQSNPPNTSTAEDLDKVSLSPMQRIERGRADILKAMSLIEPFKANRSATIEGVLIVAPRDKDDASKPTARCESSSDDERASHFAASVSEAATFLADAGYDLSLLSTECMTGVFPNVS